jgi:hypothetical protein
MMEQTSEAAQYYWSHQMIASFGLGMSCFLAGLLLGAALWAGRKTKALRLEASNEVLRREIAALGTGEEGGEVTSFSEPEDKP